jgi:hypothetical protein
LNGAIRLSRRSAWATTNACFDVGSGTSPAAVEGRFPAQLRLSWPRSASSAIRRLRPFDASGQILVFTKPKRGTPNGCIGAGDCAVRRGSCRRSSCTGQLVRIRALRSNGRRHLLRGPDPQKFICNAHTGRAFGSAQEFVRPAKLPMDGAVEGNHRLARKSAAVLYDARATEPNASARVDRLGSRRICLSGPGDAPICPVILYIMRLS